MTSTKSRRVLVSESRTVTGGIFLGAVLVAPVLSALTRTAVESLGRTPGIPEYVVIPIILGFVAAEVGGGLLGSWLAGVPYLLFTLREFHCHTGDICGPPPSTLELLPFAVAGAVIAGTIGYGGSALATRWHRDLPVWALLPLAVVAVMLAFALYPVVHGTVPWHPLLDAVLEPLGH